MKQVQSLFKRKSSSSSSSAPVDKQGGFAATVVATAVSAVPATIAAPLISSILSPIQAPVSTAITAPTVDSSAPSTTSPRFLGPVSSAPAACGMVALPETRTISPPATLAVSVPLYKREEIARRVEGGIFVTRTLPHGIPLTIPSARAVTVNEVRGFAPHLFETPCHNTILEFLTKLAVQLSNGAHVGSNGTATRTLVGARGIGKSETCMGFINAAGQLWPSVLPVYINYTGAANPNHALNHRHGAFFAILQAVGASDAVLQQCDDRCAHNVLLDQLWDLNLRVLLIIDELDKGYRDASAGPFRSTLAGLQALGNSTSGRVAVILCGSSSCLPDLICGRRKDGFRDGWPNLNSTKFSLVRIPSPSPLDEPPVASILSQTKLCPSTLVNQRHLLYLAGTNIRSLHVHLSDAKHPMPEVDLEQLEDGPHQYHKCARPLLTAILDKLIDKNKELLEELVDMKVLKAIPSQIQSVDWPSRFLPVDEIEIDALWKELQDHLKVASDLQAPLPRTLRHLLDEGVLIEVEGDYFPYSLAGLLARML